MTLSKARLVAILHAMILIGYIAAVASLPLILFEIPVMSDFLLVVISFLPATILIGSWGIWRGCVLTTLENYYREEENPGSGYQGLFTDYYMNRYFNIRITRTVNLSVLIFLVFVPVALALYRVAVI